MQALSININENLNDITAAEFARSHIVFRQEFDIAQGHFGAHFFGCQSPSSASCA
jgi:hypothetical protein